MLYILYDIYFIFDIRYNIPLLRIILLIFTINFYEKIDNSNILDILDILDIY